MESSYFQSVHISFDLIDPAGILYFSRAFELSHRIYEQFIHDRLGYCWKDWFSHPDWAVPIKHAQADYFRPVIGGRSYNISCETIDIGASSFATKYAAEKDKSPFFSVQLVHVFCSRASGKKIAIPHDVKERLSAGVFSVQRRPGEF